MEDVVKVASYIADRYQSEFGTMIDEMKLHKLLYFTQRESIIQTGAPMFPTLFEAWKYGPVLVEIRPYYRKDMLHEILPITFVQSHESVFDKVFKQYAPKDSWSLSTLSHGEYSWQQARKGMTSDEKSTVKIKLEDIYQDAKRIKERRFILDKMKALTEN